jgi:hypothetical protein
MATLNRRLDKLETQQAGKTTDVPDIVFICGVYRDDTGTITSQTDSALYMGGGGLQRGEGESETDFVARARAMK